MTRLNDEQRAAIARTHPAWTLHDESMRRTYVFADFNAAMGFVNRVALASEVADHHPDIEIRWNKVTLVLTTHSAGGLTTKDTDLATVFDGFAREPEAPA